MRALSIVELWLRMNWPGKPGKSCHMPNDADGKKAACSIFTATTGKHAGNQLFKNHRTGLTYDAPGLLAEVEGLPIKEACRLFIELSGVKPLDEPEKGKSRKARKSVAKTATPTTPEPQAGTPPLVFYRLLMPRDLDADEVEAIATTRDVSARSVEWLMRWSVIHAVSLTSDLRLPIPRESLPLSAWALHSTDWRSFRLRPFVGAFPGFQGQTHKSLTPSGASCALPVWIGSQDAQRVLIVEGEGDACGAAEIMRREGSSEGLAVVVMFSSSLSIPSSFLHRFEGRRIRIVPHVGDAKRQGEIAAVKWAASLKPWAESVEIFNLGGLVASPGAVVGDLGDLCKCSDGMLRGLGGVTAW